MLYLCKDEMIQWEICLAFTFLFTESPCILNKYAPIFFIYKAIHAIFKGVDKNNNCIMFVCLCFDMENIHSVLDYYVFYFLKYTIPIQTNQYVRWFMICTALFCTKRHTKTFGATVISVSKTIKFLLNKKVMDIVFWKS